MDNNIATTEKLFLAASCAFGASIVQIKSKSRKREIVDARKAIVYFLRKNFKMRSIDISKIINKDHSVVNYLYSAAENLINIDIEFRSKINQMRASNSIRENICPCCNRPF